MTKNMPPKILALAPQGIGGIGIVAAACRASALGILDCSRDDLRDSGPFERLEQWTRGPYGMRIRAVDILKKRELWNRADGLNVLCITLGSGEDEASLEAAIRACRRIGAACAGGSGLAGGDATRDRGRCLGPDRRGPRGGGPVWIGLLVRLAPGRAGGGRSAGLGPGRGRRAGRRGGRGRGGGRGRAGRCRCCWPASRRSARNGASGSDAGTAARRRSSMPATGRGRARLRDARLGGAGPAARGGRGGRDGLGAAVADRGRLGRGTVPARRPGCRAGGADGPQVRHGRRDRAGRRAVDRPRASRRPATARPLAEGSPMAGRARHALPDRPGPDDAGQRRRRRSPRPWPTAAGLPFLALAMLRGPEVRRLLDETARATGRPALGRGRPRLRPARAPRASSSRPSREVAAAVRPDRRRPARPGRASWSARGFARICTSPRRACSTSTSATGRGGSCSKAASAAGTSGRGRASCSGSRPRPCSPRPSSAGIAGRRDAASSSRAASTTPARPPLVAALAGAAGRAGGRRSAS